jgi:hypothetical protein
MREFPSVLLRIPPNLKINWPAKEAAAEFAEGVLRGAMREQLCVCRSNTSHYLVTSPSTPEKPPMR